MVAKNDHAHESLAKQLKDKTSDREYIALVHGDIVHQKEQSKRQSAVPKKIVKKWQSYAMGKKRERILKY